MLISRLITAFLLLMFLCETFDQDFITVAFYADQNNIAKNLCENRDYPLMHCNGKCQLQKKLNQENSNDKQTPERKTEIHNEVLSSKSFFASVQSIVLLTAAKKYFIQNINATKDNSLSFFHPPQS